MPSFFYVQSPMNLSQQKDKESGPQVGVTFNGTRRDVLIGDVIAIHGQRVPASAESSRVHRQAFIYIVGGGRGVDSAQVAKLDRIRRQWKISSSRLPTAGCVPRHGFPSRLSR